VTDGHQELDAAGRLEQGQHAQGQRVAGLEGRPAQAVAAELGPRPDGLEQEQQRAAAAPPASAAPAQPGPARPATRATGPAIMARSASRSAVASHTNPNTLVRRRMTATAPSTESATPATSVSAPSRRQPRPQRGRPPRQEPDPQRRQGDQVGVDPTLASGAPRA
jgi:hypothetical protein